MNTNRCTRLLRGTEAIACWVGPGYAHQRQAYVRCDAHWHRPRRADWRAKAYTRAAQEPCTPHRDGPRCWPVLATALAWRVQPAPFYVEMMWQGTCCDPLPGPHRREHLTAASWETAFRARLTE